MKKEKRDLVMVFGMIFFLLLRRDEIKKRKWEGKKVHGKTYRKTCGK
jgi:hypothetical protein